MAITATVYKNGVSYGSGTATAASTSITSFTATRTINSGRNVQVLFTNITASPENAISTRVVTDGGTTLTLADACPFADAG